MPRKSNATAVTICVDPGKNTFHLIGLDARGGIVLREKVSRDRIVARWRMCRPGTQGLASRLRSMDIAAQRVLQQIDLAQVFAVSSGNITDEMINEYINEQEGEPVGELNPSP